MMAIDWTESMTQDFEFYKVDPSTWLDTEKLDTVLSCKIKFDGEADTLGSVSLSMSDNIGESYVRVYLIATQDGASYKIPLCTFLLQTPSVSFDGKSQTTDIDGYMPLIELKEKNVPIGYGLLNGTKLLNTAYELIIEHSRCACTQCLEEYTLSGSFVAEESDTWLSFITDLLALTDHHLDLDATGRVLIAPDQSTSSLSPVWTYNDDNSSILYPDIKVERDLFGIPNVVEVVYSDSDTTLTSTVRNVDDDSACSIQNRGREIHYRDTKPDLDSPTQDELDAYAENELKELSALEYTITYSHGYCPVRVGDCVLLNYSAAGLTNIKAKVISQTISCATGVTVEETAVFTKAFYGGE